MSPITLETIHEIKQIIRQAGEIALRRRHAARIQLKLDRTPFTDVELEMEALIIPFLQAHFPDSQIITEENGIHGPASSSVWALDPVDGTKVFLNGLPNWGVSLGLLENGAPKLGFFYMPVSGDLYWGGKGFGAFLNEMDLTTTKRLDFDDPLAFLAVTSSAHRRFDFDYPRLHSFGSTAAHLCYVAQGIAVGALTRSVNIWDLAGVLPILDQTGIQVEFISQGLFSPVPFLNNAKLPEGLIAAHPSVMAAVRAGIHRK
ncbi:MAG: inositol monophosphatase family protein [Bellilinea sp.]